MALDPSFYEALNAAGQIGFARPKRPEPEQSGAMQRILGDTAVMGAKGVVGLGEAALGAYEFVADPVTGGAASRALAPANAALQQSQESLGEYYSTQRQAGEARYQQDKAAIDPEDSFLSRAGQTVRNLTTNPYALTSRLGESAVAMAVPMTMAARRAQTIRAAGGTDAMARTGAVRTAGAGEGLQMGGSSYSQSLVDNPDAPYQDRWYPAAGVAALGTAIPITSARYLGDVVDTAFTGARTGLRGGAQSGIMTRVPQGVLSESVEEGTQSLAETGLTNVASGREFDAGLAEAVGEGVTAGAAMGGGMTMPGKLRAQKPQINRLDSFDLTADPAVPATPVTPTFEGQGALPLAFDSEADIGMMGVRNPYDTAGFVSGPGMTVDPLGGQQDMFGQVDIPSRGQDFEADMNQLWADALGQDFEGAQPALPSRGQDFEAAMNEVVGTVNGKPITAWEHRQQEQKRAAEAAKFQAAQPALPSRGQDFEAAMNEVVGTVNGKPITEWEHRQQEQKRAAEAAKVQAAQEKVQAAQEKVQAAAQKKISGEAWQGSEEDRLLLGKAHAAFMGTGAKQGQWTSLMAGVTSAKGLVDKIAKNNNPQKAGFEKFNLAHLALTGQDIPGTSVAPTAKRTANVTAEQRVAILEADEQNQAGVKTTQRDIATQTGISQAVVNRVLREEKPARGKTTRVAKKGKAVTLTKEQEVAVVEAFLSYPDSPTNISKKLELDETAVGAFMRNSGMNRAAPADTRAETGDGVEELEASGVTVTKGATKSGIGSGKNWRAKYNNGVGFASTAFSDEEVQTAYTTALEQLDAARKKGDTTKAQEAQSIMKAIEAAEPARAARRPKTPGTVKEDEVEVTEETPLENMSPRAVYELLGGRNLKFKDLTPEEQLDFDDMVSAAQRGDEGARQEVNQFVQNKAEANNVQAAFSKVELTAEEKVARIENKDDAFLDDVEVEADVVEDGKWTKGREKFWVVVNSLQEDIESLRALRACIAG